MQLYIYAYHTADYLNYITAVHAALQRISNGRLQLRGPAGLFHPNRSKHPLCWGLLQYCNSTADLSTECPLQMLTYHRKGYDGTAASILNATIDLIAELRAEFPRLMASMRYANSEADPMTGWSHPLTGNANVEYAAVLVENVLLHWTALRGDNNGGGFLPQLAGLSHDNAFLSYHPYEFDQRTVLAHFQMNETGLPADVQLFTKPVYSAIGMLALTLGPALSAVRWRHKCAWVKSKNIKSNKDGWYASVLLVSQGGNVSRSLAESVAFSAGRDKIRLRFDAPSDEDCWWFAEFLEQNTTDPQHVWLKHGAPAYPDAKLRQRMRRAQV